MLLLYSQKIRLQVIDVNILFVCLHCSSNEDNSKQFDRQLSLLVFILRVDRWFGFFYEECL